MYEMKKPIGLRTQLVISNKPRVILIPWEVITRCWPAPYMLLRYHMILHSAIYVRRERNKPNRGGALTDLLYILSRNQWEKDWVPAQTILRSNTVDNVKEGIRTIHISQLYYLTRYPPHDPASPSSRLRANRREISRGHARPVVRDAENERNNTRLGHALVPIQQKSVLARSERVHEREMQRRER